MHLKMLNIIVISLFMFKPYRIHFYVILQVMIANNGSITLNEFLNFVYSSLRIISIVFDITEVTEDFKINYSDELDLSEFVNKICSIVISLIPKHHDKQFLKNGLNNHFLDNVINDYLRNPEIISYIHAFVRKNIDSLLMEELLDSLLPLIINYKNMKLEDIIERPMDLRNSRKNIFEKLTQNPHNNKYNNNSSRKKSLKDVEVEIHVHDERKSQRKTFKCSKALLVEKMGYFSQLKGRRLEELDISVHCDINIFEWLLKWINSDFSHDYKNMPKLELTNIIQIIVSASFLQMEPLLEKCIHFFKDNLNNLLKDGITFYGINEPIIDRLANIFTNGELLKVIDTKDKILSKLYCKFIMALEDRKPDYLKGHYSSICNLYMCKTCKNILNPDVGPYIPCKVKYLHIDNIGNVKAIHIADNTWNINDFIKDLKHKLRSWKKVYWRLWGICHFLLCSQCSSYYSVANSKCCIYHPNFPHFNHNEELNKITPIGLYPCCHQRTFKLEVIPCLSGCKYKRHLPTENLKNAKQIIKIASEFEEYICVEPTLINSELYSTLRFNNNNEAQNTFRTNNNDAVKSTKAVSNDQYFNYWQSYISIRNNQDIQREQEEKSLTVYIKKITHCKKLNNIFTITWPVPHYINGGAYSFLDEEIREEMYQENGINRSNSVSSCSSRCSSNRHKKF